MLGTLSAPAGVGQSADASILRAVFSGQAKLLAHRADQCLPITSGSLVRLFQLAEQLDAVLPSWECSE
jgi:hypothetical protein